MFVEPRSGFEPPTSSLPRKCSTPELSGRNLRFGLCCNINDVFVGDLSDAMHPTKRDSKVTQLPVHLERETGLEPATLSLEG